MERQRKTELRIGNLLMHEGKIETVSSVHSDGTVRFYSENKKSCHGCYGLINVDPIPLTEEWVVKFGFVEVDQYFDNKKVYTFYRKHDQTQIDYYNSKIYVNDFPMEIEVKTVHQLQNLYFALTGQELTINE